MLLLGQSLVIIKFQILFLLIEQSFVHYIMSFFVGFTKIILRIYRKIKQVLYMCRHCCMHF